MCHKGGGKERKKTGVCNNAIHSMRLLDRERDQNFYKSTQLFRSSRPGTIWLKDVEGL